jgi:hypothetical protein
MLALSFGVIAPQQDHVLVHEDDVIIRNVIKFDILHGRMGKRLRLICKPFKLRSVQRISSKVFTAKHSSGRATACD